MTGEFNRGPEPQSISPEFRALLGRQMQEQLAAGIYATYIQAIHHEQAIVRAVLPHSRRLPRYDDAANPQNEYPLLPAIVHEPLDESPTSTLVIRRVDPDNLRYIFASEAIVSDEQGSDAGFIKTSDSAFSQEQIDLLVQHVTEHMPFQHELPER